MGALKRAGAQDDSGGVQVTGRRLGYEAPRCPIDRSDGHALPDERPGCGSVSPEVGDDFVAGHEAVGIVARVGPTREAHGPVRGDEAEAVPAIPPRLADPAALQDDVADPEAHELMAGRKTGGPAPYDQDVDALHWHGQAVFVPAVLNAIARCQFSTSATLWVTTTFGMAIPSAGASGRPGGRDGYRLRGPRV